jgi:hypothetical protein
VAGNGGNYKRALLQTTKLSARKRCFWTISDGITVVNQRSGSLAIAKPLKVGELSPSLLFFVTASQQWPCFHQFSPIVTLLFALAWSARLAPDFRYIALINMGRHASDCARLGRCGARGGMINKTTTPLRIQLLFLS